MPLPSGRNAKRRPIDVFMSQVESKPSGCMEWSGKLFRNGYGCFGLKGRYLLAHRVAYFIQHGALPGLGGVVMHSCDNRKCCNPNHLRSGTHRENLQDMVAKGRDNPTRGEASYRATMTDDKVRQLRSMRTDLAMIFKDLGTYFGISTKQATVIANRGQWSHI